MNRKWSAFFILFSACAIFIVHGIMPHEHHDHPFEISLTNNDLNHKHHNNDHDHSVFTFGHIEDYFIRNHNQINLDQVTVCQIKFAYEVFNIVSDDYSCKTEFAVIDQSPPEQEYYSSFSHRGPPTV